MAELKLVDKIQKLSREFDCRIDIIMRVDEAKKFLKFNRGNIED